MKKVSGAIVAKSIHRTPYVSALIKTTKDKRKILVFPEPNLFHIYYRIAVNHLEKAENAQQTFHDAHNSTPEQEYDAFCVFFEEIVQGIVFLLMTVEGFVNQLPEGRTYTIQEVEKKQR
jgi:hypothetical protein